MKKEVFVLAAALVGSGYTSAYAQAISAVRFQNRNIATPDPNPTLPNGQPNPNYIPGGNNNGSFNIPIWFVFPDRRIGAGLFPGGVTAGLFYQNNLLATALFGTTEASAPFFVTPITQDVVIKDAAGNVAAPSSTPLLTVRIWSTASGSFDAARNNGGPWGEWTFTSPPISDGSGPPPTLTTWGEQVGGPTYSNTGFTLFFTPEPSTIALGMLGIGALALARRPNRLSR